MRIVHTSDWHIGKFVNEYCMLEDQQYYFQNFLTMLIEEKADALIVAGDLYDRSVPSSEAVALVDQVLSEIVTKLNIPVLIISGNHDSRERLSFLSNLFESAQLYIAGMPSAEIKKVTLADDYGKVNFYLLPYLDPYSGKKLFSDPLIKTYDQVYEAAAKAMEDTWDASERNILIAHGFFNYIYGQDKSSDDPIFSDSEISIGGSDLVNIRRFADFDYIALGHLHIPQKIYRETIRYSGSILKYSVSESNREKTIPIIDIKEKGNTKIHMRAIEQLRDLRILTGTFEELLSYNTEDLQNSDDYIFCHLTDKEMIVDGASKLKSVFPNLLGIKYIAVHQGEAVIQSARVIQTKTTAELYKDFYQSVIGQEIDEEKLTIINQIISDVQGEV